MNVTLGRTVVLAACGIQLLLACETDVDRMASKRASMTPVAASPGAARPGPASPGAAGPSPAPTDPRMATFFGMHFHRMHQSTVWPSIPIRLWRMTDAEVYWSNIETSKGKYDWARLDSNLAKAEAHGADILMPLFMTPRFYSARPDDKSPYGLGQCAEPKDMADWSGWVHTLATRYKGRIRYYEIWNEPLLSDFDKINPANWFFFNGSTAKLIELGQLAATEIRKADPAARLVSPSFVGEDTARLEHYLDAGGGIAEHIIGYHMYVKVPEALPPLVTKLRRALAARGLSSRPLWNTEAGYSIGSRERPVTPWPGHTEIMDEQTTAAYVARSIILNWAAGVEALAWYAWDNYVMGLAEPSGTHKPAADAYARAQEWLSRTSTASCGVQSGDLWSCSLVRDGHAAWLYWTASGSAEIASPLATAGALLTRLDGSTDSLQPAATLSIGGSPVLIEH